MYIRVLILFSFLLTGCQSFRHSLVIFPAQQLIDYPVGTQRYVVIAVMDHNVSEPQAKQAALQRAAKITLDEGYLYFMILSQEKVWVAPTDPAYQPAAKNLYQELIMQRNTNTELRALNPNEGEEGLIPALRFTIECSHEKPFLKKSFNAKTLAE